MENLYKLKEEFLSIWSEEKVKQMTLEEYTNLDREHYEMMMDEDIEYSVGIPVNPTLN